MKRINLLLCITGTLFYSSFLNAQAWTLIAPNDVYRPNKVGIGFNSAPSLGLSLEVDGPIGFSYGNFLGVRGLSSGQNKLIESAWDGTNNFDYLAFYTAGSNSANNGEKMRITMMGKVSLGAGNDPLAKLDVYEQTSLGQLQNNTMLLSRMGGNCASGSISHNQWLVRHTNGNGSGTAFLRDGMSMGTNNLDASISTCNVKTWWNRDPGHDAQAWGTDQQTYFSLDQGKAGVNIDYLNSPIGGRARLQVEENTTSDPNVWIPTKAFVAKTYHTADLAYCIVADVNRDKTIAYSVNNRNFNGTGVEGSPFTVYGNGQVELNSKLTEDMVHVTPSTLDTYLQPVLYVRDALSSQGDYNFKIYRSGSTVIGKRRVWGSHNDSKLAVDGKIVCSEVVVTQTGWADFVFDKNYKLMPLKDLEHYYKQNHHLPCIPSTQEIIDNGNDLAKTDALLLQKVEELTLYIVELKKEIDALKKELKNK